MCGRYRLSRRKQMIQEYFDTAEEVDWESLPIQDEPEGGVSFQYKVSLGRMAC